MRKITLIFLAALLCATPVFSMSGYGKTTDRDALVQEVKDLTRRQREFKKLDEMAPFYRKKRLDPNTGSFLIYFYYNSILNVLFSSSSEKESDADYLAALEVMEEWKGRCPDSLTRRVVEASIGINYGWFARGGGICG